MFSSRSNNASLMPRYRHRENRVMEDYVSRSWFQFSSESLKDPYIQNPDHGPDEISAF